MNNCHHRLLRVLHQAALTVAFSGAIFSGSAQAQTWYLTTNRVWYSHPTSPGNFIAVVPDGFHASFTVPGQGVLFEADWRMPTTITTATSTNRLRVTMTGPDRITNSVRATPPYMMLDAIGRGGNDDTIADNGYDWGLLDPASLSYVFEHKSPFYTPTTNHVMLGPYDWEDNLFYEIQVWGTTWDASGQLMQDEIHVFYYYSRTPPPLVDRLELSNPMPEPSTPLIGGTRTFLVGNLRYSLGNYDRADLMLVVETNNTRLAYSERVRIGLANNKVIFNLNTLDFEVPANIPNLNLKALMLNAESGEVIKESFAVTYTIAPAVLMPIEIGTVEANDREGNTFRPETFPRFYSGVNIREMLSYRDVAFEVQMPQQGSELMRRLSLVMIASSHDGAVLGSEMLCGKDLAPMVNGRIKLRPTEKDRYGPLWQQFVEFGVGDHLEFFATLMSEGGQVIKSPSINVSLERIGWRPGTKPKLLVGDHESRLIAKADYHTDLGGNRGLEIELGTSDASSFSYYLEVNGIDAYRAGTLVPPSAGSVGTVDFNLMLPLSAAQVRQRQNNHIGWRYFHARAVMLPVAPSTLAARSLFSHLEIQSYLDLRAPATETLGIQFDSVHLSNPSVIGVLATSMSGAIWVNSANGEAINKGAGAAAGSVKNGLGTPVQADQVLWLNHTWAFDPALPADGSFSALLTLAYDPSIIPDDPGFDENRLTIISYDPQTGQLRSYPTLLDRSNRLASASINSLDRFWTLGATPRGPGSVLNFPMLRSQGGFTSGLFAVNSGSQPAEVTLTAYDNMGSVITGGAITNPVTVSLAALLAAEWTPAGLFNISSSYQDGWVQLRSRSSSVVGLLRIQTPSRADGISAGAPTGVGFLMPGLVADTNTTCEIHVVNPTVFNGGMVLTLIASNGQAVATNSADLPAKGRLTANLTNLFPALSLPFAGYLRAQGDVEMAASALLVRPSSLVALTSQPRPFDGEAATNAWAARYTTGGNALRSRLTLANLATNPITLHLEAVRDDGTVRSATDLSLPVGTQTTDELNHLFGWSLDTESTGSLRVGAPGGFLAGNLQVTDAASNTVAATACPLVTAPANRFVFPYLNQEPDRYIEVSVLNPQPAGVTVYLSVHGTNGALIGATNLTLASGARLTCPLADCVPASAGLTSGFFLLESTQPVVAEALAGETSGNTLMAIPAVVSVLASNQTAGPAIEIVPAGLGFGTVLVGGSLLRSVEIRNRGTALLTVQGLSSADSRVAILAPGTPFDLAVGQTRTIDLRFTPTSVNLWTGSVTVASSDPMRQQVTISLAGWGSTPTLEITQEDNTVLVSWPAEAGDYHLQTSPDVLSLNWTNQQGSPTVISNRMRMIITNDSQQRFFRLAR